eukprot:145046_1
MLKTARREIIINTEMVHKNISSVLESFVNEEGVNHLVLERMPENSLSLIEANPCGLSMYFVREFMHQLMEALEYVYQKGVIHRDIKPENILIDCNRDPLLLKICDFGAGRNIEGNAAAYEKKKYNLNHSKG